MLVREEALPFAAPPALAAALLGAFGHLWWASIPALAALAVCAFFRDPEREASELPDAILSPADGKVIKAQDLGDGRVLVSVFMSVFNVHVNRSPVSGPAVTVTYNPGKFMAAWSEKASLDNEQVRVTFSTPRGNVTVVQIAGLIARRIVSWARPGKVFARGERIGLIRFGSRLDLYLPAGDVEILAVPGQGARAGVTALARWRTRL
jgi:phosphatidylserine decarboxylase